MKKLVVKMVLGIFVLMLGFVCVRLSFAEHRYGYDPSEEMQIKKALLLERVTLDYTVGLITYFGGGEAKVVPPGPAAKEFNYTIKILRQPEGEPLNEERVSLIPREVIANLPRLREEAISQKISLEERIKQFVEEWLEKRYPAFMEEVGKQEQAYRAEFEDALNTLLGISNKSQLSKDKQKVYQSMVDNFIERMKNSFIYSYKFAPDDLLIEVTEYMPAIEPAVASFIKTATGEEFDLFNSIHAGFLTYWADWAFSYARPAEISKEEAIEEATAALADRKALVQDVNERIFQGKGNPLSAEFGRVLSYFADMVVYNEYNYDQIRKEIEAFGEKLSETRQEITSIVSRLGVDTSTEEGQKIVEKFNLLLLGKLFEVFDKEALDEFAEEHKDDPGLVDDVRYSRYYTADKEDIKASYVCALGADDFFGGVEYQEVTGKIKQYVDDMIAINNKFQEKFGKSYDITTLDGVESLLGWAYAVENTMEIYIRQNKSTAEAHQLALQDVFKTIEGLSKFPEEEAYLGDTQFAVDAQDNDVPMVPSEPVAVDFGLEDLL